MPHSYFTQGPISRSQAIHIPLLLTHRSQSLNTSTESTRMSIAEKFNFYHETVNLSSEEALRLAKEEWDKESEEERRSIRELEMKRLELEMKRLDQGRVCVPKIVVSFVKIAML